ncbi:MAG: 6-hydroxymethylpterin diphosphokinase MptE-like protein [Halobacteriota archaeon]
MEFSEWEPLYERVLADFGFDRAADERARDVLASYAVPFDVSRFDFVSGRPVTVVGAAPSLAAEIEAAGNELAAGGTSPIVFAASTAVDVLLAADVSVDLMVTDLDKNPRTARRLTHEGVPVAAHAHGDNVPLVREWVPTFEAENVLATTQAAPVATVANFGGFTDGDRAAFIADAFGASQLRFLGWDFDDESVETIKRKKLAWAARLLRVLERRRDERFPLLDGRRDTLDEFLEEQRLEE